jgi:hypothetical protein
LNIDLKTNSSNTYFINAFTPKTDKVGENRAVIERSSERRGSAKDYSQNKFLTFKTDSVNHSIQLKTSQQRKYNNSTLLEPSKK